MRIIVRKHYKILATFVALANIAWQAILRGHDFPGFEELRPHADHRELLRRIDRHVERRFRRIKLPEVPPLFLPSWNQYVRAEWRALHAYALVRRVFDSLSFITRPIGTVSTRGRSMLLLLEIRTENGMTVRRPDPFEEFLAALYSRDLGRVRSCVECGRFFVALRSDQKACRFTCANRFRVKKCRQNKGKYLENRKFRKRTGLKALRRGRQRLIKLSDALRPDLQDGG